MTRLRFKLVESLSRNIYLLEAKIEQIPQVSEISDKKLRKILDSDPSKTIEDLIATSNDLDILRAITAEILKKNNISDEKFINPIQRSIIAYRSIDPRINPIIQIYDNFNGKSPLDADKLFQIGNSLANNSLPKNIIAKYFKPETNILEYNSQDLNYIISLLAILSDRYKVKNYKNAFGKNPTFDDLLDNGKFKDIREVKAIMDTYLTDDDEKLIYLKNWFKREKQDNYKDFILTGINEYKSELSKEIQENLNQFIAYLDQLFLKGNEKTLDSMLLDLEIPESFVTSNPDDLKESKLYIINKLYERSKEKKTQSRSDSVDAILDKAGYTNISQKFEALNKSIDKLNIDKAQKLSAKSKLYLLMDSKNKALSDKLFDTQIPDGDINKLPQVINNFLNQAIKQNYLYTTIREALALKGKQPSEGKEILNHYIHGISNKDVIPNYLDRFNKVWNNKKLRGELLNARITKTASGAFNWVKAITDFLNNIRI